MSRYTGPKEKNCRRYGFSMCHKPKGKCGFDRRKSSPGEKAVRTRRRLSEYGMQLREKQKTMAIYGVKEKQFRRYYDIASRKEEITGDVLVKMLERRLDNVVFRLGFAQTRQQARQSVNHGHILVNESKVDIPSYTVNTGDIISWKESSTKKGVYGIAKSQISRGYRVPTWLNLNKHSMVGKVLTEPVFSQKDLGISTRLIVEYYSRR